MSSALAFETASCPASLEVPWVESDSLITSPAIQIEKIGIVLYNELLLAMVGQLRTTGGDHTPTAWRNEGRGVVVKISFRTITKVTSVIPMFFCAPPNMTAYLLTSNGRLRKLELMSATISLSSLPACEPRLRGKLGNSTPSTVYKVVRSQHITRLKRGSLRQKRSRQKRKTCLIVTIVHKGTSTAFGRG